MVVERLKSCDNIVALAQELGFEDWFQPIEQGLLTHAIVDRGNAEHSMLTGFPLLRDRMLSHRQRLIGVFFQLSMQPFQLLL